MFLESLVTEFVTCMEHHVLEFRSSAFCQQTFFFSVLMDSSGSPLLWKALIRSKDLSDILRMEISLIVPAYPACALPQVFAGNRERTVVAWEPPKEALEETVALSGHTGWVRALATCGQWLFSGSCSTMRQWDMSRAVPRLLCDVKLDKGDIQSLTCSSNSVYACSADGSIQCVPSRSTLSTRSPDECRLRHLSEQYVSAQERIIMILTLAIWWRRRAWTVDKRTGTLAATHSEPKAHSDRITASRWLGNYLYTGAKRNRDCLSVGTVSLAFPAANSAKFCDSRQLNANKCIIQSKARQCAANI